MSTFAKITFTTILVILLIIAGAAITNMFRPAPAPVVASPSPTPTAVVNTIDANTSNPFDATIVNPFEDEAYSNPFPSETTSPDETNEEYVNPFTNL